MNVCLIWLRSGVCGALEMLISHRRRIKKHTKGLKATRTQRRTSILSPPLCSPSLPSELSWKNFRPSRKCTNLLAQWNAVLARILEDWQSHSVGRYNVIYLQNNGYIPVQAAVWLEYLHLRPNPKTCFPFICLSFHKLGMLNLMANEAITSCLLH